MIASTWTTASDVASGVIALLVVVLLRTVWKLQERLSRLEGRIDGERRR